MRIPLKQNVLIVDDEPDIRSLVQDILSDLSVSFSQATNGAEALSLIANNDFDLILSDYNMPRMDGLEMLKMLREKRADAMVIWLTGRGSQALHEDALSHGAFEYLEKPIDPKILRSAVKTALKLRGGWAARTRKAAFEKSGLRELNLLLDQRVCQQIEEYCNARQCSISDYFAQLILADLGPIPEPVPIQEDIELDEEHAPDAEAP